VADSDTPVPSRPGADTPGKPDSTRPYGRSRGDFGTLSEAEEKVLAHAAGRPPKPDGASGAAAQRYESCEIAGERPSREPQDDKDRIRASFIRFLLLGGDERTPVHEGGVWVKGGYIQGDLDLRGCECKLPFQLEKCWIKGSLLLQGAKLRLVSLNGSWFTSIKGDAVKVESGVYLRDITTAGSVRFVAADITGPLDCESAHIKHYDGSALILTDVTIKGMLRLSNGFQAQGQVRLRNATIGGSFECNRGVFTGVRLDGKTDQQLAALDFEGAKIAGSLVCSGARFSSPGPVAILGGEANVGGLSRLGCTVEGEARLSGASFGSNLDFSGGTFKNPKGNAIDLTTAKVKRDVLFAGGFVAEGTVSLWGVEIGGSLNCTDATFKTPEGDALFCSGAVIKGHVVLGGNFTATGSVSLIGADVAGELSCWGGTLDKPKSGSPVLDCSLAKIGSQVILGSEFTATGGVSLHSARIASHLHCVATRLRNDQGAALDCDAVKVGGAVWLERGQRSSEGQMVWREFESHGEVRFVAAEIGLQFICESPSLQNMRPMPTDPQRAGWAFNLGNARIADTLFLAVERQDPDGISVRQAANINGSLCLSGLRVRELVDCEFVRTEEPDRYFPRTIPGTELKCTVDLDGFVYERLGGDSTRAFAARRHWLERQPEKHLAADFRHQPFDHLVKVLRAMGHDDEAREIAILKQRCVTGRIPPRTRWLGVAALVAILIAAYFGSWPIAAVTALGASVLLFLSNAGLWLWRTVVLDGLVAYGYRPARALAIAGVIAVALSWFYDQAQKGGAIVETARPGQTSPPPTFYPFIYSFDVMLPVVKLGEAEAWKPANTEFTLRGPWGLGQASVGPQITLYLVWAEKAFGWLAGAILIAVVGGLIKKDS
jgi:hypothetical protein